MQAVQHPVVVNFGILRARSPSASLGAALTTLMKALSFGLTSSKTIHYESILLCHAISRADPMIIRPPHSPIQMPNAPHPNLKHKT